MSGALFVDMQGTRLVLARDAQGFGLFNAQTGEKVINVFNDDEYKSPVHNHLHILPGPADDPFVEAEELESVPPLEESPPEDVEEASKVETGATQLSMKELRALRDQEKASEPPEEDTPPVEETDASTEE